MFFGKVYERNVRDVLLRRDACCREVGCDNPRIHGKPFTGNHAGRWRYRVGDYRIMAEISDDTIIIYIVNIGHRKNIY